MSIIRVEEIINEVCSKVEAEKLAILLDYHVPKIQVAGNQVKCFCPLHKEQAFRSLILDVKKQTYRCTMKRCVGFQGGNFVDLWALHTDAEPLEAALDLAEKLELDIDVARLRALGGDMVEKARTALAEEQLTEARQSADQAVAFLPNDIEAARVSAEIYEASGDTESAQEEYLRVADLGIVAGEYKVAREILAPLLKADSDSPDVTQRLVSLARAEENPAALSKALLHLAGIYSRNGEKMLELQTIQELEETGGQDPETLEQIAGLHETGGRIAEMLDALKRAGAAYQQADRWARAFEVLERCESHDDEDLELKEQLAEALLQLEDSDRAAERFLALASLHKNLGDLDKAQELIRRLLRLLPEHVEALERLAEWTSEAGQPGEAIELYRKLAARARKSDNKEESARYLELAKGIDPDDYDLRYDLAQAMLDQDRVEEGVAELFELANLYLAEATPEKGFEILKQISDLYPEDAENQIRIGQCLEAAGFEEQSLQSYLRFIERMQEMGSHAAALKVCEAASQMAPLSEELLAARIESSLELGQKEEALVACREAAKACVAQGDDERAESILQRGIKIDRTDPQTKADLAQLMERNDRAGEAVELWIEVALYHRAAERNERALQAAREALRLAPDNTEAKGLVAEEYEKQGQISEALALWKSMAHQLLGEDSESAEALKVLEHAIEIAPTDLEVLAAASRLKARIDGPEKARPLFNKWLESANATTHPAEQMEAYQQAVEHYPDVLEFRSRLAELYIDRGTTEEAMPHLERMLVAYRAKSKSGSDYLSTLERTVELYPQRLDLRVEWAEALAGIGELERSGAIFSDIARHFLANGDHEAGLKVLHKSLQYQPENRDLLAQIAELHEGFGSPQDALKAWERIADLNRQAGDSERNLPVIRKLLQLRPDNLDLRLELAEIHEELGSLEDAVTAYFKVLQIWQKDQPKAGETLDLARKIVELAPEFNEGRELFVEILLKLGRTEEAKTQLDQMGEIALNNGNLVQAEGIYKRIQEIDPADIASGERLGKLYEARGQNEEAASAYRNVLAVYRERRESERIVSVLRKLKGLTPHDLDVRQELARALVDVPDAEEEICEEWFELISLALTDGDPARADAAMKESAPFFAGRWDHRFGLARLFAEHSSESDGAAVWKNLAREALEAQNHAIARNAASEALCLTPGDAGVREIRIEASLKLDDAEVAESDLRILVDECIQLGEYASAESYLSQVIDLRPDDTELIELLAEAQIAQENRKDAISTLSHVVGLYRQQGDLKAATDRARQICDLDERSIASLETLADLLLESEKTDEAMATWKEIGASLVEAGKVKEGIRRYESVLTHVDHDIDALRQVADLTRQAEGPEKALPCYERLLEVMTEDAPLEETEAEFARVTEANPGQLRLAEKYAAFLFKGGKVSEAENEFVRISRVYLKEKNEPEEALRTIDVLRMLDPENLAVMREEATILEATGKKAEAADLLNELAEAYRGVGKREDAVYALAQRAEILIDEAPAQVSAAEGFEELGEIDKATTLYLRGIEIYEKAGEVEPTIPLLLQAIALNPDRMDLSDRLGRAYDETGQTAQAVDHWLETGQQYEKLGQETEALEVYRHVKTLETANLESRRRIARLSETAGDSKVALAELREMVSITLGLEDHEETIQVLTHILELDPQDTDARVALVQEYAATGQDELRYEALCDLEHHYMEAGQYDRALQILNQLKDLRPHDLDLTQRSIDLLVRTGEKEAALDLGIELVDTHLQVDDAEKASEAAARVTDIAPDNVDIRRRIASLALEHDQAELALKEYTRGHDDFWGQDLGEKALELCEAGLEELPEDVALQKLLIKTLIRLRESDRAIAAQLKLASTFEAKGQDEAADEIYEQILMAHPDHIETHEACVNFSLKQGDLARTTDHLTRLAEIHFAEGRLAESIESLERLVELEPSQKEFLLRLAELYFENEQPEKAKDLWMSTAKDLQVSGDLDRAIEVFERVKDQFGASVEVLAPLVECLAEAGPENRYIKYAGQLGRAHVEEEDYPGAISVYQQMLLRDSSNIEVLELLADAQVKTGDTDAAAESYKHLFELYSGARRYEEAKASLEKALEFCDLDVDMLRKLGDICLRLNQKADGMKHLGNAALQLKAAGELEDAREVVERILKSDPANLETRRLLGNICEDMGDNESALKHYGLAARGAAEKNDDPLAINLFEHLLKIDPNLQKEREAYAKTLERTGRFEEARDQYLKLIESLDASDDPRQKIRFCRQILKDDPNQPDAHEHLYQVYEETGKTRLALAECLWLAEHFENQDETEKAEAYMRRGLKLSPEEIDLLKRLVDLLLRTDQEEEAGEKLDTLASVAQKKADSRTARWALMRACEASPSNLEYRMKLAESQEQAGEHAEARQTRVEMMRIYLEQGQMEDARLLGERIADSAAEDESIRMRIADIFEQAGLPEVAAYHHTIIAKSALVAGRSQRVIEITNHILKIKPRHVTAREYRLEALVALGEGTMARDEARELYTLHLKTEDYEGAERSLKFLIQQKPSDPEPRRWIVDMYRTMGREEPMVEHLRRLAEIYVNMGDVDRAITSYKELLETRPEDARARMRYIDLYSQLHDETELFDDYLLLAMAHQKNGEVQEATRIYEDLIERFSQNAPCREKFVDFLFEQGQLDRGVAESRALAEIYLNTGQDVEASRVLDRALSRAPKDVELRQQLAMLQVRTNRRGLALETYKELLKHYEVTADEAKQLEILDRMLELDDSNVEQRQRLADLCSKLGRTEEATAQRKLLAQQYLDKQLYDLAEREFRRILDITPEDTDIWHKVIDTHLKIGSPSEAVPDMTALASLYVEAGRLKDAVNMYRRILDIEVDNVEILSRYIEVYVQIGLEQDLIDDYLHLATLLSQRGDIKGAMQIYYHLREIAPEDERVDKGLEETGALAKIQSSPKPSSPAASGPAGEHLSDFLEEKEHESYGAELQLEKTVQNYKNILKLNPENPAVRAKLADLLMRLDRVEEADEHWSHAAQDFFTRGDFTRCIEIYEELMKRHPNDAHLRERLSRAVIQKDSMRAIQSAIDHSPNR